jgi:hypothetical protein
VTDLSGGAWRALTHGGDEAAWPASAAHQERRKVLVRTETGAVLLKFVGLGDHGLAALDRARTLHAAGFTPEPLGWRHGFLVERWVESRPLRPTDRPRLLATLADYLGFRRSMPAPYPGADSADLAEMARVNVAQALGAGFAGRVPDAPRTTASPVAGDNRLHAWEWRVSPNGAILKTDAVDHAFAHDLVGRNRPPGTSPAPSSNSI